MTALIWTLHDLTGHLGNRIRGAARDRGALCAAVTAVFTAHYLTRSFRGGNLNPFGIYCLLFGAAMIIYNA